ncbi:hypothetical protein L6164_012999 [Bauhinia variegata]|uniref:Uncharacterized protein n=1 Tax=Bauhinia variegata TaxID=167791 RepID=A0ACB9PAR9_BAUVA|nr:hypothetical protein L6164_012999 [Bauhinia variegata]
MSIRTNPERAVPALLQHLTSELTKKINTNEDRALFAKIEEDLNNMKDLLPQLQKCEQKLLDQFTDLDRKLRNANKGNVTFLLRRIDSEINQIKSSISHLQQTLNANVVTVEQAVPLLRYAVLTVIVDGHDPLLEKLNKTEEEINGVMALFLAVKRWERNIVEKFADLDRHLRNFDAENIRSALDGIHSEVIQVKTSVSLLQEMPLIERASSNLQLQVLNTHVVTVEQAVSTLKNRLRNTVLTIIVDEDNALLEKINKLEDDINSIIALFAAINRWEQSLVEKFTNLGRHLGNCDDEIINSALDGILAEMGLIKTSVSQLQKMPLIGRASSGPVRDREGSERPEASKLEEKIFASTAINPAMKSFQASYDYIDGLHLKLCFLFLSIFPENAVIKKWPLIYLWIGEGLIKEEKEGEEIFEELLKLDLIIPCRNGISPIVNKCKIHPWIRYMLISLAKNAELFDFDSRGIPHSDITICRRACLLLDHENGLRENENLRTIFNLSGQYLVFEPELLAKLKKLVVLQLGRWQDSPTHHIEVLNEAFLKDLRNQKHLKYLSLRGISRITALPPSIVGLINLEILDLKACHNLETLPGDISPLRKLTHLDVSECYLLESMPKGIDKLASLQVLKGFIVGNSKKTPCKIEDLKVLEKLKRLSIHIGSEAVIRPGEFDKLKDLKTVRCLKISWGVVSQKLKEQVEKEPFSFPPCLEKLALEGIPQKELPGWLRPSKLKELKKLYIKGGELSNLDDRETERWKVEILRLKYLKNLHIEGLELKRLFPLLKCVDRESEQIE